MDLATRLASGAVCLELSPADAVHHAFGDDRSGRIVCAQEQDVEPMVFHLLAPLLARHRRDVSATTGPHSSGRPWQQSSVRSVRSLRMPSTSMATRTKRPW